MAKLRHVSRQRTLDAQDVDAKRLFRHKWMELCQGLNGEPFIRGHGDGVCVVPIDAQGNVLM
jgi:hypothetical protein